MPTLLSTPYTYIHTYIHTCTHTCIHTHLLSPSALRRKQSHHSDPFIWLLAALYQTGQSRDTSYMCACVCVCVWNVSILCNIGVHCFDVVYIFRMSANMIIVMFDVYIYHVCFNRIRDKYTCTFVCVYDLYVWYVCIICMYACAYVFSCVRFGCSMCYFVLCVCISCFYVYVCLYVCIYVCMYVCMYLCM
jgi:nuclear pore complex protein Nup62